MPIITKLKTYWRLPGREKRMFAVNLVLCGVARAAIKCLPYRRLAIFLGEPRQMVVASSLISQHQRAQAQLIGRSVRLAARYTPWESSCLTQALVASWWCRRYGVPYWLFIGFAKGRTQPLGREAHAWIMAGPVAITGGYSFSGYQVVLSYSNKASTVAPG